MASKIDFEFEEFAKLCPTEDIERFRDSYDVMFDMNGIVLSTTVGFHFSFDEDDPALEQQFTEMVTLFSPVVIWAGTEEIQQKVAKLGFQSNVVSYFQDGGFIVVLKIPFEPSVSVT